MSKVELKINPFFPTIDMPNRCGGHTKYLSDFGVRFSAIQQLANYRNVGIFQFCPSASIAVEFGIHYLFMANIINMQTPFEIFDSVVCFASVLVFYSTAVSKFSAFYRRE
jgi:hypothetical protein